jgi:hypothetical protein
MNEFAIKQVSDIYLNMLNEFKLALAITLDQKQKITPKVSRQLTQALLSVKKRRIGELVEAVANNSRAISFTGIALTTSDPLDRIEIESVLEHSDECAESLIEALVLCINRDIATCSKVVQRVALKEMLSGKGDIQPGLVSEVQFEQLDVLGRRWMSIDFIRRVIAQTFKLILIDSAVLSAKLQGQARLVVYSAQAESSNEGLVFSVSGNELGRPSYMDIRDSVFHPNSTALVRVE